MNLQEDWDTCLLNGFYKYPQTNTYFMYLCFIETHQLDHEQILKLKRTPRHTGHNKVTILRFICAYLPKIADILWKHKDAEIAKIAGIMSKSSYDTQTDMVDKNLWKKEMNEIQKSKKENIRAKLSREGQNHVYDSHRLSGTWGVTK